MSRIITLPEIGIIIDGIYRNYSKPKVDQKNINKLAADCSVSVTVLLKVRSILVKRKLLVVIGERAQQKCYWNPERCSPNPTLLTDVYREYTKDAKSRVKVVERAKRLPSIESALLAFKKAGWEEVILKKTAGYKAVQESYNLTKMGE